jgi:prephenate dehydratase
MAQSEGGDSVPYRLTYQGQPGAFSEDAAFDFVEPGTPLLPSRTLEDAFDAVEQGGATYALIPVENTLAGPIDETFDLMSVRDLVIVDETVQPISHCLIAEKGTRIDQVEKIYSHPIALAQCAGFLESHAEWESVPAFDTAGAVEMVIRDQMPASAAIASARAAQVYGGDVLLEGIQDHPENYTRFLLFCRSDTNYPGASTSGVVKTSICLRVAHSERRTFGVLRPFVEHHVPLTHVLSRPVEGSSTESMYHVDFIGTTDDDGVSSALTELRKGTTSVKVLGTYPLRVATIREVVRSGMP